MLRRKGLKHVKQTQTENNKSENSTKVEIKGSRRFPQVPVELEFTATLELFSSFKDHKLFVNENFVSCS